MSLPEVAELIPHAGPMRLLHRVVSHDAAATVCEVRPAASALFADGRGRVPAYVGIEYMAQCIAAHAGLVARGRGEAPRPGVFLGSRGVALHASAFEPGQKLRVEARPIARASSGFASFACAIWDASDERSLAKGRLSVMELSSDALPSGSDP